MFLAGIFSGFIIIGLLAIYVLPRMMFTVNESRYDFEKTIQAITESTQTNNWKMPHHYDLQQIMANNGFTVRPVKVFSVCKPDIAVRILGNDQFRLISVLMPCRVSVYEKADGKTYISRINPAIFQRVMGGKAGTIMGEAGEGIEQILKSIVGKQNTGS